MRYSDDLIEEIRSANDIVDVISQYVRLQRRGANYFGLCPFHNEKSPSFSVSPSKQMYYCFGCGEGGNVITFLMKYENETFQEALKKLADRAGIRLPEPELSGEARAESDRKGKLLEINKLAAEYFYRKLRTPAGKNAMDYLKKRGLSDEIIRSFGLGYSDRYSDDLYRFMKKRGYADELLKDSGLFHFDERHGFGDKFWNRVMFPIMDVNRRVIGFGGRVMGEGKPKYLNSPETVIFDKSRNLYGLYAAKRAGKKNMIICEGYMDVISMHQAGYTNSVASLGTALTSQQCALLHRYTGDVLVIYDMDEAGVKAALRAIPMLRNAGLRTKVVNLRPHKDPDEFIKAEGGEAFEKRLKEAENSFLFTVRMSERDYDMDDPQGRTDFLHHTASMLAEIEDELERTSYLETVAGKYGTDPELLRREVGRASLRGTGRQMIRVPKAPPGRKTVSRDSAEDQTQKLMLTWLTSRPELIPGLKGYLGPEDFTDPLYREVAEMIWQQAEHGQISPASVINHFQDGDTQSRAASLFHTNLQLDKDGNIRQAFADLFFRMKTASLEAKEKALDQTDLSGLQKIIEERRSLERLRTEGLPDSLITPKKDG